MNKQNNTIYAEIESLKEIFIKTNTEEERFYQVPDYQRPYSWDEDNINDLVDDLITSYENSIDDNYFCGSIVLVKNERDKRYDIIDGQQRITSFTILACVLRDVLSDRKESDNEVKQLLDKSIDYKVDGESKLKFLTDTSRVNDFRKVLETSEKVENNSNRYLRNYFHFKKNDQLKLESIESFISWLYEKVVLTVIMCPSQDIAIQIFDVLNNRGMPLSPIDILKSSLMRNISLDENKEEFKNTWSTMLSDIESNDFTIDNILTSYLYFKKAANPKTRLDKELIEIFKKENINSLKAVGEMKDFSEAYIKLFKKHDKYLYCLRYLRHSIYWNSILSTAIFTRYQHFDELKKLLLAFYYQNWIAGSTIARTKQTSFNILQAVKKNEDIATIEKLMTDKLKEYNISDSFRKNVSSNLVYNQKWAKPLLLLVEYYWQDNSSFSFIKMDKQLHLEHILPIEYEEYGWDKLFNEEERFKWTNSLSNLTLLSDRKNKQAQNFSFEKKKEAYGLKDSVITAFRTTQEVFDKPKWTVEELEKRKERIVRKIKQIVDIF